MKIKPITDKLSYSAIRAYCTSPALFWKHYVVHDPFVPTLTMLAGKAWHRGLEEYYKGNNEYVEYAVDAFVKGYDDILDSTPTSKAQDLGVKFKKEAELLEANLKIYPEMERQWEPSDIIERKVTMPSPVKGGIPISGVIDILEKQKNPIDHKYISRRDNSGINKYKVQAWFYYYLVKHETGKYPTYFLISEFKKAKNRDKSSQLQEKILEYEDSWIKKIDKFYLEVCEQILGQKHFIPNPFSLYGDESWDLYLND